MEVEPLSGKQLYVVRRKVITVRKTNIRTEDKFTWGFLPLRSWHLLGEAFADSSRLFQQLGLKRGQTEAGREQVALTGGRSVPGLCSSPPGAS
ncbi:hypothetical protein CapIbe_013099 [Capra ibex]